MILRALPDRIVDVDVDDFTRLHVDVCGQSAEQLRALVSTDPTLSIEEDGKHVWIEVRRLEVAAEGCGLEHWREGFGAMTKYAAMKGWVSEGGKHIRAHVENIG